MATHPVTFVKQAFDELKKVKWPSRDDVIRLTISVVVISIIVGIFLGSMDFFLTNLIDTVLSR